MSHSHLWMLSTVFARTLIVLLWLTGGLRLLGKRQLGQMNIYDLAMIMALANSVQNAMTMGKGELGVGIVSAGTLLLFGRVMTSLFVKLPRLEATLVGTPTTIISQGALIPAHIAREHITEAQLMQALHAHGLNKVAQVELAVLETDGTMSVVPRAAAEADVSC